MATVVDGLRRATGLPGLALDEGLNRLERQLRGEAPEESPPYEAVLTARERNRTIEQAALIDQVINARQRPTSSGIGVKAAGTVFDATMNFCKNNPGLALGGMILYATPPGKWLFGTALDLTAQLSTYVVPPMVQAGLTYLGYEYFRSGGLAYNHVVNGDKPTSQTAKSIEIPKQLSVGGLLYCVDKDVRSVATTLFTSTVKNTILTCMAVDYANIAIKEGALVPRCIVKLAEDANDKIPKIASFASNKLQSLYNYSTDPKTWTSAGERFELGVKTIYENAATATLLGTAATVGAAALGLPGIGALALATAVPLGFSCERLLVPHSSK